MRIKACCAAIMGFIVSFGIVASAGAKSDRTEPLSDLGGLVFAVEAKILVSNDPSIPVGLTFDNCYTFNEDGSWEDPLFPGPGLEDAIPGIWIQHTERPKIVYTATIDLDGLLLIQNGTVRTGRGNDSDSDSDSDSDNKRKLRLTAYTTVIFGGNFLVAEVVSRGHAVETCPFF